jgi:YegS/Rv2252/BmrU family lipid kinase
MLDRDEKKYRSFQLELPKDLDDFTGILIIGGDGTVNHLMNHFGDIEIPIGIIPAGSGNDLAQGFLPSNDLDSQYRSALNGTLHKVDAGICNGRIFLNGMGMGFDGEVALEIPKVKWLNGHLKYLIVVIKKIFTYREKIMRMEWDGHIRDQETFMVFLANGPRTGGGFKIAPSAKCDDGKFDMIIVRRISIMQRLRFLPVIEKGKHIGLPFIDFSHAQQISITSAEMLNAQLDGELMQSKRFDVRIMPGKYMFRYGTDLVDSIG